MICFTNDVCAALSQELEHTLKEGRSLIVEGFHVDPSLFFSKATNGSSSKSSVIINCLVTSSSDDRETLLFLQMGNETSVLPAHVCRNLDALETYLTAQAKAAGFPFTHITSDLESLVCRLFSSPFLVVTAILLNRRTSPP